MVLGALVGVLAIVGLAIVFKKDITNFLSGGLTGAGEAISQGAQDINISITQAGEEIAKGAEQVGTGFSKTVIDPQVDALFKAKEFVEKSQQAQELGFSSIKELEIKTDPNRIQTIQDVTKFNPPNTVGFGIKSINEGKGLPDTPENRLKVLEVSQSQTMKDLGIAQPNNVQTEKTLTALAQESKNIQAETKPQPQIQNVNPFTNIASFIGRFGGQSQTKGVTQNIARNPPIPKPKPEIIVNQTGTGTTTNPFRSSQPDRTLVSPFLAGTGGKQTDRTKRPTRFSN